MKNLDNPTIAVTAPRSRRVFIAMVVGSVVGAFRLTRLLGKERDATCANPHTSTLVSRDRPHLVYRRHHNDGEPVGTSALKPAYEMEDEGQRLVLSAACTQRGCGATVKFDDASGTFHCSCGARYDRAGSAVAGPSTEPLARFAARVVDDVV
jgi:hypothetical protein